VKYSPISVRLRIISHRFFCVRNQYQQVFLVPLPGRKMVCLDNLRLPIPCIILLSFLLSHLFFHLTFSILMDNLNSITIIQISAPMETSLVPQPIQTPSYRLSPRLIALVQSPSFSGEGDENPYLHIRDFEQTCDCLRIACPMKLSVGSSSLFH